jgi:hypothetical protein
MKLLHLTENSWLATSDMVGNIGLIFKRDDSYISTHNSDKIYTSLKEIADEYHEKLEEKQLEENKINLDVFGYPIRHDIMFDPKNDNNVPTYKIKEDSNIRYVAGYWVVYTDYKYRTAFCPKESTISKECLGPYKDLFNARAILNTVQK